MNDKTKDNTGSNCNSIRSLGWVRDLCYGVEEELVVHLKHVVPLTEEEAEDGRRLSYPSSKLELPAISIP